MAGTDGGAEERPRAGGRRTPLFATCAPGLRRMLRQRLAAIEGVTVTGTGGDGRCDIVFAETGRPGRAEILRLRLADEVFAEIGRASRAGGAGPAAVAASTVEPAGLERALSVRAQEIRPLAGSMTFRVSARVLPDSPFGPADLRRAAAARLAAARPRWRSGGEPQLDIRICEWHDGQYAAGLSLADVSRAGCAADSQLAGSIAAAMVGLAGRPGQPGATLLDPCCGGGVILAEALAAGWRAEGTDTDAGRVAAAAAAAAGASVELGDARELLLTDASMTACVSELPSGPVPGGWQGWAAAVLTEISRVTASGGSVVLLAPELPRADALRLRKQVPVRLPGGRSIWAFRRS